MSDDSLSASAPAGAAVSYHAGTLARAINVAEVVGEAPLGRVQILVMTVCALVTILDGCNVR